MNAITLGAAAFGVVIGWMTYMVLHHKDIATWSDLTSVIAIVGGAGVLSLFPAQSTLFGAYAIGLFIGFFGYAITFIILARKARTSWERIIMGRQAVFSMNAPENDDLEYEDRFG